MQCEFFALEGLSELMATLKTVRKKYNRYLDIEGVLFTMYSGRLNLTMQVVAQGQKVLWRQGLPRRHSAHRAPERGPELRYADQLL